MPATLLWAAGWSALLLTPPIGTDVNEVYPDFVLPLAPAAGTNPQDRHATLRLSDHRGRRVLLIHFASW